jgi:hypothetical protein
MFSEDYRNRVRDEALRLAESDPRIVAGAVVGSLAHGDGDRWSDLDLTFAVEDGIPLRAVLDDWTRHFGELGAVHLFDVGSGAAIYRVFLLPDCLQFDLSFAPASEFAAAGPKFRLLFGSSVERPHPSPPSAHDLLGYAVHHALRARFCIERGRVFHAEYWISGVRHYGLSLACRLRGLPAHYGRGYDDLPREVSAPFARALAASLDREELMRALRGAIEALWSVVEHAPDVDGMAGLAAQVAPALRQLTRHWGE